MPPCVCVCAHVNAAVHVHAVDPHVVLTSNHNAPFSLQKHLFRPPYVTEVCKTEFCHWLFKECNVALGVARSPEGGFWVTGGRS